MAGLAVIEAPCCRIFRLDHGEMLAGIWWAVARHPGRRRRAGMPADDASRRR